MAYLDHEEAFEDLKERALAGIRAHFPVEGREHTLVLKGLEVAADKGAHDDIEGQHKAKVEGSTFSRPIYATLALKHKDTGKEVVQKLHVGELPLVTRRYSYIVGGQEYQVDSQWQLKPGVYTKRRESGELETRFNITNRPDFDVTFDPATKHFMMERGKSKAIPVYPLMKAMGVDDDTLEKHWGKDVLEANRQARGASTALERFYKADRKSAPSSREVAASYAREVLAGSELHPDSTELTLGKPFRAVDGDVLTRATAKMLQVQAGKVPEDDRDNLVFKDLRSVGDYAYDKLTDWRVQRSLKAKMLRQINTASSPRDVVRTELFNKPLLDTFKKNAAVRTADQLNPVEMVSSSMATTIMGPGGIKSENAIVDEAKLINPSHLGFLDPLHTPEGCFDEQTEVFTETGWVLWPHVTESTRFACLIGGKLEFHPATELQRYKYEGRMYGLRRPQLEYLVTPNHRMLCRPFDKGSAYRVVSAAEMHGKPRKFRSAHDPLETVEQPLFYVPVVEGNNSSVNVDSVPFELWAELVGWFVSEGHCRYDEESSTYHVHLFQSDCNADCCSRIVWLLSQLPYSWSVSKREEGRNRYTIGVKQLAHYMQQLGTTASEKRLPSGFLQWPLTARRRLLDALLWGDGRLTTTHARVKQNSASYTTTSARLATEVEQLAISLGYPTTLKRYEDKRQERYLDVYEVRLLRKSECSSQTSSRTRHSPYYTVDYAGDVYCASVPGTFLYVRRNGKRPVWLGNSKTGVTLHLPIGVKKVGKEPMIPVYNLRTGKKELIGPRTFMRSSVVLPDQVKWGDDQRPRPVSSTVKVSSVKNELEEQPFKDADYAMYHPSQAFSMTSNLIPFMGNNSGNRATYATSHLEQAISLEDRDVPLVQVGTGGKGVRSYEEFVGRHSAHSAPVAGTVLHADKERGVVIRGEDGKQHRVQLYNNFPLNDSKSVMDSTPTVKVGDRVSAGQNVADNNYTRGGTLALGKNLTVAYIPYKGYNFEDGVVISESAAHSLRSVHMHKPQLKVQEGDVGNPKKFQIQHPEAYRKEQYEKLGDDGVVRVGQKVLPGDPLVLNTRQVQINDRSGIARIRRSLSGQQTDASLRWDSSHAGEVVGVYRNKRGEVSVHVRTVEPMQVGDKITGRHGNKGIVTKVVPDEEMPVTKGGERIQVALNPSGIPGRMNIGQVLETVASKIAKKDGKPFIIDNFEHGVDQVGRMQKELAARGLQDQEELIDPATGKSLGKALVGYQHMLKLHHQVDKKALARSGMTLRGETPETYDINLQPTSGGKASGQSIGSLGINVLLAHGATANIREMQTWKSEGPDPAPEGKKWPSQHHEVWNNIQQGLPLPAPRPTFAFQKFTDMLRAAGVNVEKKGSKLQLSPLTDKDILAMSAGELRQPSRLTSTTLDRDGSLKPIPGGLFDERATGGIGGKRWSHFKLAEPMPNPVYEEPIKKVLGLTGTQFNAVVSGDSALDARGKVVPLGKGETGGPAIAAALERLDVAKELAKAQKELDDARIPAGIAHGAATQKLDTALKKVKYLGLLHAKDIRPHEAYVLRNVPVLPPAMRPPSVMQDGSVRWEDLNGLYKDFAANNGQLEGYKKRSHLGVDDAELRESRRAQYDGLRALIGVGRSKAESEGENKGIMQLISGNSPKEGYFQKTLLSRRQDMTMRSTIVPEPALGLDEVAVPREQAITLYRPFVVQKMVSLGMAKHPLEAQEILAKKGAYTNAGVQKALEAAVADRPVLMKRDPALHKHNVQAFTVRPTKGKAIKVHPLVVSGYNADFDGDAMSMYVPISDDAVEEARRMMPTRNLFNEATGRVTFTPTLDSALGLYKMTQVTGSGKKRFANAADAMKAVQAGSHRIDELAHIEGYGKTTPGRVLIADALPKPMQAKVLHDHDFKLSARGVGELYGQLAKEHKADFADAANKLKDYGFEASYGHITLRNPSNPAQSQVVPVGTHSLGLEDFRPDREVRDRVVQETQKRVDAIRRGSLTPEQKEVRTIEEWTKATEQMEKEHRAKAGAKSDNLFKMLDAGVKPSWKQYQQMRLAPMLLEDARGRTIPMPVTKSYSEGLDLAGYWIQSSGARKGAIQKVQEVRDPGYFSKRLVHSTMNLVVTGHDCGTSRGIGMPVGKEEVYDRELAADAVVKGRTFPAGTVLSPDVVGQMRRLDKGAQVVVRSAMKCEHGKGLCQKCAGLSPNGTYYDLGSNVGVLGAQALGERSVQLALKAFHSGGVKGTGGAGTLGAFERTQQLTLLPKKIPDAAALAMTSGTITKIEPERTGHNVYINDVKHFVPFDRAGRSLLSPVGPVGSWAPPVVGMKVEAGHSLSDPTRSHVNPHDLYRATRNIEKVQNYLASELHSIFKPEGVRRQHIETVVRALGNVSRVTHPGDVEGVLKGEFQPTSEMRATNRALVQQGRRPADYTPVLKGIDVMPLVVQEDWMAKLNHERLTKTLTDAAAEGAVSDLHGLNPTPGMAYGAEFGLAKKKSLFKPPHIAGLPSWSY
jgi:DNA-directed RNA polymerase subunit beta'